MKPTVNFLFRPNTGNFYVVSTRNTLRYTPGDYVRRKDVDQLIATKMYIVNVKAGGIKK